MTTDEFFARLNNVRPRGAGRSSASCPAHDDQNPSLSITEGERGLLLKCWAGCSIDEICNALGIQQKALFFDELDTDPRQRREAAQCRALRKAAQRRRGHFVDTCKLAEQFLESRRDIDISAWSDARLGWELDLVADAYHLLEHDPYGY